MAHLEGETVESVADATVTVKNNDNEPLTSEEVRAAASDLYTHAKNVWLKPVRKEVRGWFRAGKSFLDGLGEDKEKRDG